MTPDHRQPPVPDGRRLRWTEHRAARRAAFVAAGVAAVDEFGSDASAEQIAATAEVSRTVLYRYFRDREDLRQAIAERIVQLVLADVVPKLAGGPESTRHEIISTVIGAVIGWLDVHPNLYHFLRSRRTGTSLDAVESTLAGEVGSLLQVLLLGFGLDEAQAVPGAHGIVGMVEAVGAWWLADRAISGDEVCELISHWVWHLLGGLAGDNKLDLGYDEPLPGFPFPTRKS